MDRDLWNRFKGYALRRGVGVSRALEELMEDALVELELDRALAEIGSDYEIDFDPVEPRGPVSDLVREARSGRADSLSR